MDRQELLDRLPTNGDFARLKPPQQKIVAENAIASVIDAIDAEARQPDLWEAGWLWLSVSAVPNGFYLTALRFVRMALMTPALREPGLDPDRREMGEPTLNALRQALAAARDAAVISYC